MRSSNLYLIGVPQRERENGNVHKKIMAVNFQDSWKPGIYRVRMHSITQTRQWKRNPHLELCGVTAEQTSPKQQWEPENTSISSKF